MPMIMRSPCGRGYRCSRGLLRERPLGDALGDGLAHPRDRLRQASEDRLANDKVPDIQLPHLRQGSEVCGGFVVEAMACVDFDARLGGEPGRACEPFEFALGCGGIAGQPRFAILPRVKLHNRRPELNGGVDLPGLGIDEERDPDASIQEAPHHRRERVMAARRVEPALGGNLLPALRHDAAGVRPGADRDGGHFLRRRHLKVERRVDLRHDPADILVADVPAVLAQMRGNAIGARLDGNLRRADRIGTGTRPWRS